MKRMSHFLLFLLSLLFPAVQNAYAGSAVVWNGHQLYAAWGYPVELAKTLAVQTGKQRYGGHFRVVAYSSVEGYGAIAVASKGRGPGAIIGVSLGQASEREAKDQSMQECLKAGGLKPKVARTFKG